MFLLNGNPISIDNPFVAENGTKYANLRDPAVRDALGIVEVADPEQYDQRFYWGVGNPKQLNDLEVSPEDGEPYTQPGLKSQWVAQVKDTTNKLLAQTDWMVIRKAERNVEIPASVVTYRAAVVAECNRLEAAITASTSVEELIEVVESQNWAEAK